ncbi:MAG: response regulator [bacterium]|nr:response regulator [bacterium]
MSGISVLVIDDDVDILSSISRQLRAESMQVFTAATGQEGLEQLEQHRSDLVLLDLTLPGIDGYETCRRIRANSEHDLTKVILVADKRRIEERISGYSVGADDFISKPYDIGELLAKIRIHLRLKHEEEINRIKSDLLGLISHETRTPLTVIVGSANMIRDEQEQPASRELVDLIIENGERLQEFIQKANLLCDLKSDRKLTRHSGQLWEQMLEVADGMVVTATHKSVEIAIDIDKSIELDVDWDLINQVITYLLANAIKYSPPNETVMLAAEMEMDLCRIRVSDRGEGISAEWIDKIYTEIAIRDILQHRGQGLSLSIARQVVAAHGGEINVVSEIGKGAVFEIGLPVPVLVPG